MGTNIFKMASLVLALVFVMASCRPSDNSLYGYETEVICHKEDTHQYNTYKVTRSDGKEWRTTQVVAYVGKIEGIDMLVSSSDIKNFRRIATSDAQIEEPEHVDATWTTISRTIINRYNGSLFARHGKIDIPRCVMRTIETDVIFTDTETGKVITFENSIKTEIIANGIEKHFKGEKTKILYGTIGRYVGTYFVEIKSTLNGEPFNSSRADFNMYLPTH